MLCNLLISLHFIRTLSTQLVPGDAKIFLSLVDEEGEERTVLNMTADWGNDRASVTFKEPQPMKYSMDFSVDTKGQSGEVSGRYRVANLNRSWTTV